MLNPVRNDTALDEGVFGVYVFTIGVCCVFCSRTQATHLQHQHLPNTFPNTFPTPAQHLPNTFPTPSQHLHVLTLFAASSSPRFACPMRPNNGCHVCCRCVRFHCTRCPPQVLRFGHQPANLLCSKSTSRDHGCSPG